MRASFGYADGSGEYYIIVDTDRCNGCGDCVSLCPAEVLALRDNEYDPVAENRIAVVKDVNRKSIKYDCAPCKPTSGDPSLACVDACKVDAIAHSW